MGLMGAMRPSALAFASLRPPILEGRIGIRELMPDAVQSHPDHAPPERAGALEGARVIAAYETLDSVGHKIAAIVLQKPGNWHWFGAFCAALLLAIVSLAVQGAWSAQGQTDPDGAAAAVRVMDIVSYDAWIGIACGSLFVSAILRLAEVEWRCAITRIAETVALLAAVGALCLSILRPGWLWEVETGLAALWPVAMPADPRAILVSDATGLAMLLVVSSCIWSVGLLPDLAALHDMKLGRQMEGDGAARRSFRRRVYGWLSASWSGSARQWQGWVVLTRTLAYLAMILCAALQAAAAVRVAAMMPQGGFSSLFPVTLLVGSVLSGTGLITAFVVALRAFCRLQGLITERHLDILARMLLVLGLVSLYGHVTEICATLLNGGEAARADLAVRIGGEAAILFWIHVVFCLAAVQLFWSRRARSSALVIGIVAMMTVIGTLADRMTLVLVQHAPLDAAARGAAIFQGIAGFLGALAIVVTLFLLSLRAIPILSIAELRGLALLRNPGAIEERTRPPNVVTARFPNAAVRPGGFVEAAFASDLALATAIGTLAERRSSMRLSAYGPAPLPHTASMLRIPEPAIRDSALAGALIGGIGFFAACQWDITLDLAPSSVRDSLAWPFLVLPSVAFATLAATLAALLAYGLGGFFHPDDRAQTGRRSRPVPPDHFLLAAMPPDGDGDAVWIEGRLAAISDRSLRPLAVNRRW